MKKGDSDAIGRAMGAFERAGKELVENGVISEKTRQKAASEIAPREVYLRALNRYFDAQIQRNSTN